MPVTLPTKTTTTDDATWKTPSYAMGKKNDNELNATAIVCHSRESPSDKEWAL